MARKDCEAAVISAPSGDPSLSPRDVVVPVSTRAKSIFELSVLVVSGAAIFCAVFTLIVYTTLKFSMRRQDYGPDLAQVYESGHAELAWTILPLVIVLVVFLAMAQELRSEAIDQN